ncbi:putative ribonuclease H-like domain-containing protein [Tanacetum coccineum]|uniref:Ribonuclease H-like domain-containing protein n=1 Tax=Tanacetum coccineum TaxID=301880 RepID=A0ABQ5DJA2_9ASTR
MDHSSPSSSSSDTKNEAVYEEDIAFLKYDVKVRDNSITELKNQLEETLKEKDDLKLKLEKFETSSKKLTKLINSQISVNNKTGVGFNSQMNENELNDIHMNKSEVFESASHSSMNESEKDNNQVNDRYKAGKGYHAVPPPYTGNFMPLRPDLSFAGLDDSIFKSAVSETVTSVHESKTSASKTSKESLEKPKTVRSSAPLIEKWESDSDDDCVIRSSIEQNKPTENVSKSQSSRVDKRNWNGMMTQKLGDGFEFKKKACFVCGSLNHLIKDCNFYESKMVGKSVFNNKGKATSQREIRPVWNNAKRVNHQNFSNNLTHPHPRSNFVPSAVMTNSGKVPVNTAKQSFPRAAISTSTARYVNIVASRPTVYGAKPSSNVFHKSHSPVKRTFNQRTTTKNSEKVNTAKGNPQHALKNQGIVDSGCSRHMTGNKAYLSDYQEINGGFVAFRGSSKGGGLTCLFVKATIDESNLWHRRFGHINFKTINKLVRGNLVRGLPSKIIENDHTCVACQKGKQHKASCKTKLVSSISQPLQMLHMDLFGLTFVKSLNKKMYCLVVTDDFSRCDNGTEFKNSEMNQFCQMKGIKREFSVARTPQQNGVAERKNRTLIEAARTMLADSLLPTTFWAEAINIACYVQNRVLVTKPHNKTPYELLIGRPPNLDFVRPFGCPVTILNTLDHLGKFEGKVDEEFLVGYSVNSKAFRVFNTRTRKVEENLHIKFLENKSNVAGSGPKWLFDIDSLTKSMNYEPVTAGNQTNDDAGIETNVNSGQAGQEKASNHEYILLPFMPSNSPLSLSTQNSDDKDADEVPGKGYKGVSKGSGIDGQERTNSSTQDVNTDAPSINTANANINTGSLNINTASPIPNDPSMTSLEETGIFDDAYDDREVGAEADKNNLEPSTVVSPIPTTRVHKDHPKEQIIGDLNLATQTRRMINFSKENAMIEAMQEELLQFKLQKVWTLVDLPNGYTQEEGIDYDEVFSPVARIEAIRLFLAYASFMGFIVYQMDVKSAFLYGTIEEEVYVDDIIFGFTKKSLCVEFEQIMHKRFQMSSKGELTFFLGLQVKKKDDGIFISQDKYVADILKKFDFSLVKTASTLMEPNKALIKDAEVEDVDVHLYRSMIGSLMYLTAFRPDIMFAVCACARLQVTPKVSHLHAVKRIFRYLKGHPKLGFWYPRDSPFDLEAFFDSDYMGASLDKKSTTRGCQFLGKRLISWQCKKQTIVANSTTEAKYVAAANCCGQNPVFHSKTKHIEIRHHFIKDSYEKRLIQVIKIHTDHNVADLLTKMVLVMNLELKLVVERLMLPGKILRQTQYGCLSKPTGSERFQEIVDFLNGSHLRYALTTNPTIYVSLIEKFWQTATVRTVDNGEQEIAATVDGKEFTITEASVRRHLQLADADEPSNVCPLKMLRSTTIKRVRQYQGLSDDHSQLLGAAYTLFRCHVSSPLHSPLHQQTQTPRQVLNKVTELPQTSEPIPNVPDEAVYEEWDDRVKRATTIAASLDAAQDSGNILKT